MIETELLNNYTGFRIKGGHKMEEKKKIRVYVTDQMVLIGLGFAVFYWIIDTILYIFLSYELNFIQRIVGPEIGGMASRLIVLCLFAIFGSHVQFTINKRKQAEDESIRYRQQLEELIEKQTAELRAVREQLQK